MTKTIVKKVLGYIGRYKILLFLSILCAAVSSLLALYVPILIGQAIDYIIGAGNVDFEKILLILYKIAVTVAVTALLQWIMNILNNRITFNVVRDMRNKAFQKLQVLPFSYLDGHSSGETVSRVITDADQLADGLLMGFTQLFTGVVTIIGKLGFKKYINVWIALRVVVLTPMSLLLANFIASKTYKMFRKQSQAIGGDHYQSESHRGVRTQRRKSAKV